jgi:predicted DNA binding CopG/RHH family protein
MKKEYNLKKLKKRPGPVKVIPDAAKVAISIRLDGGELAELRTEAERLGLPYQTLIGSILHRYVAGELVDRTSPDLKKLLKDVV